MKKTLNELISKTTSVKKVTEGNESGSSGKMSFTVVYNKNGKRVTLSKKLAQELKIADEAHISFIVEDGIVLLGKFISDDEDARIVLNFKDESSTDDSMPTGKKIAYNADASYAIAHNFELDYKNHSSHSFNRISIDTSNPENPVAIITIKEVTDGKDA